MTENEEKIVELLEKTTKGIMAQINAILGMVIGLMVSQGVSEEKAYELYKQTLYIAQKEFNLQPIKEKLKDYD